MARLRAGEPKGRQHGRVARLARAGWITSTWLVGLLLIFHCGLVESVAADSAIRKCTVVRDAIVNRQPEGHLTAETGSKPFEVIFSHLDSEAPRMKGNVADTALQVLRRDHEGLWLVEATSGGINLYALLNDPTRGLHRWLVIAKAYSIVPGYPMGVAAIGPCE